MTGQVESFELESSKSASSIRYALLLDDSTKRNSWYQHVQPLLRTRAIAMALAGIMIVIGVSTIPSRSGSHEELPTKTSSGLAERGHDEKSSSLIGLPLGDEESTTTSFLIGDILIAGTCQAFRGHGDPGFLPFGEEIDRTFCEDEMEHERWSESLQYSEVIRCYNVTHRWCFVNDLPPEVLEFDNATYNELASCVFQFYNHGGVLYSVFGQRMPEAFNSRCSDKLKSELWYTVLPITGCGKEYRYRFCDNQGNIDWDMVNGVGPFNCREFSAIDVYKEGSEDESGMENLCKEQTKGCADRLQLACKDGKYDYDLRQPEVDPKAECLTTDYLVDYNLAGGHVNEKGEDLICLP